MKTGKPVVLVLLTGRPLTLTWEDAHVPSILNVWFGGSEAGRAVADVLFGDVNPSGKLPSTFPQHVGQIPLHYNHKNTGRPLPEGKWFSKYTSNYLDVNNEPLYPFGHGLSYTTFSISDPVVSTMTPKGDQILTVMATLTNTGNTAGKEVIQLYIRDRVGSVTRPVKELKKFQKIELKPGEKKSIRFDLNTDDLKFYNYDLIYDWEPGAFDIMLGSNSKDVKTITVNWSK
jgi:beta-glucosidase